MLALHLFCAGDCGDYFGDLEPNFVQQIAAIKAALSNGAAGATLSFDSSSSPDYWCELMPAGYQDRFRHVPSIESGSVSDIVSFMRWSRALYPDAVGIYALGGHGFAWDDTIIQHRFGTRGATEVRSLLKTQAATGRSVFAGRRAILRRLSEARWEASANASRGDISVRGLLPDAGSKDYLSDVELKELIYTIVSDSAIGRPSVFVLDACSMASIEVLGQMRGAADVIVASFDEEPAQGTPFDAVLARSRELAQADDIARALIAAFRARYGGLPTSYGGFGPQH